MKLISKSKFSEVYENNDGTFSYKEGDYIRNCLYFKSISDDYFNEIKKQFFTQAIKEDAYLELKKIFEKKNTNSKITKFYLLNVMSKTKIWKPKWSVDEIFNDKNKLGLLVGLFENKEFFSEDVISNLNTAFRLNSYNIAQLPSNFPMKTTRYILNKYNVNNNYFDFSCGWASRMLTSISENINYFGTDPNFELVEKLEQINDDFKKVNKTETNVKIYTQGSEIFIDELKNKIGIAFSSPPYFTLEDYKIGNQSINNRDYNKWLTDYLEKTIINISEYLISGGYFIINIKSFKTFNMLEDTYNIALKYFDFVCIENLEVTKRHNIIQLNKSSDEQIMVFKKI